MTSPTPQSRDALCDELGRQFPELDAATVQLAVDHGMQVAQLLSGAPEDLMWARARVLARDRLDAAAYRASRRGTAARADGGVSATS